MGTAIAMTVLAVRSQALADAGANDTAAQVGGMQWAFGVGAILGVGIVAVSVLMPHRPDGFGADSVDSPDTQPDAAH
ncbi:hypothetical protein [Hoyosella altamirensis]|uniref:MFS transporter n=1 Tax=Hoyosella altamirensis TaxID=616997 RepID=A0A839RRB1_9ACTN|nr:hypothetical protein [Hoyosella altamirensis]MBB3038636.1 hypothetical protein [Hoyosella altamirensis]